MTDLSRMSTEQTPLNEETVLTYDSSNNSSPSISSDSISSKSSKLAKEDDFEFIPPLSANQQKLPDITLRGIILGLTIGSILSFTNMYFGLQTGWISMMSLQSSLIGFAGGKLLRTQPKYKAIDTESGLPNKARWWDFSIEFGIKENVFVQTVAVATATMPLAGGFVGIIPALSMLTPEDRPIPNLPSGLNLTTHQLLIWGLGIAFFGVFFAVPLRNQVIIKEKLKFPSGTATAQMIKVLHGQSDKNDNNQFDEDDEFKSGLESEYPKHQSTSTQESTNQDDLKEENKIADEETRTQWNALLSTFTISGAMTLITTLYPSFGVWPIFDIIVPVASQWNWYFSPALSYMGQGVIMGLPTTLSMLLGAVVGWGVLAPLSSYLGWASGPINDWKDGPRGWILWVSLAVMISESLISLLLITYKEVSNQFISYRSSTTISSGHESSTSEEVIPKWALYSGIIASGLGCILAISHIFDEIPVTSIIISLVMGCILSVLAVRALGETDLNPVSGIGKVSQVVFSILLPGNLVGNLVAGGVAEAGAMQAGDMMQDLKTGHLLNASPRAQFLGQLLGSAVSVFVSVFAYKLYTTSYVIPGPEFQVPTAQVWLDMARLVNGHPLPPHSGQVALIFSLLFALVPIYHHLYPKSKLGPYLPSGIAFAIGIYNPPNFTIPRLFGALIAEAYLNSWYSKYLVTPYRQLYCRMYHPHHQITTLQCQEYDPRRRSFHPLPNTSQSEDKNQFYKVLCIVIASGLVLGEGTMAIVVLITKVLTK